MIVCWLMQGCHWRLFFYSTCSTFSKRSPLSYNSTIATEFYQTKYFIENSRTNRIITKVTVLLMTICPWLACLEIFTLFSEGFCLFIKNKIKNIIRYLRIWMPTSFIYIVRVKIVDFMNMSETRKFGFENTIRCFI